MSKKKKSQKRRQKKIIETKYDYAVYKFDKPINLGKEFNNTIVSSHESVLIPNKIVPKGTKKLAILENIIKPLPKNISSKENSILVIREGGIGDIIASLYGIAKLKISYPNIKITYMCRYKYHNILQYFPSLIDTVVKPILDFNTLKKFNYLVYLDKIIEQSTINIHDQFADIMNMNIDNSTTDLVTSMNTAYQPNKKRTVIGLQYKTNAVIRDYNVEKIVDLINRINEIYGVGVFLLGPPNDNKYIDYFRSKTKGGIIANGCGERQYSLGQLMSVMSQFKFIIAPDSSMLHIAGITDTPMIGLFGPFPSNSRIKYYNNAIGIDGVAECSPCFRHDPISFCKFNNGEGMCLNNIDIDLIMEQVDFIMKEVSND
jgi:ADP-heptose:LPS heptosyltransferase